MDKGNLDLFYQITGRKITTARKRKEPTITQELLAKEIGISRTSMVNIEKGRQRVSLHLLWQMADFLQVDFSELVPTEKELSSTISSNIDELINKQSELSEAEKIAIKNLISDKL